MSEGSINIFLIRCLEIITSKVFSSTVYNCGSTQITMVSKDYTLSNISIQLLNHCQRHILPKT